jgi:hypothetical protein
VLCRFCPVQKKFSTEGQNRRCAHAPSIKIARIERG